jgi:hypothetical protein
MANQLKISVDFYNDTEKALFQKYDNASEINKIIGENTEISKDEFEAYMMFTKQMEVVGYRTYDELKSHISEELGNLEDFISFENNSVKAMHPSAIMNQIDYTEKIGVALGLCLINKIHALSQADWKKIPESTKEKTLDYDFQIASDGVKFIKVENKGCVVENNTLKGSINTKRNDIKEKKVTARAKDTISGSPDLKNLYYGVIGVLDNRNDSKAKVWLIDPPTFEVDIDPKKYKLLARLHYYLDEFKNIGVKKSITKALEERLKLISNSEDYMQYNNKPLLDKFYSSGFVKYMQDKYITLVDTNEAFGKSFIVNHGKSTYCYIIAMPKALMRIIVNQNFEEILYYSYNPEFISDKIQVKVRVSQEMKNEFKSVENLKFVYNERTKMNEAVFHGKVSHTTDGRVFGMLGYEMGETPKGGKNLVNTPVGIRGERINNIVEIVKKREQAQKEFGLIVKSPEIKRVEIPSIKIDRSYFSTEDVLKLNTKLKQKAKDKDTELLAETE